MSVNETTNNGTELVASGGIVGFLRRLFAGAEIARLETRIAELVRDVEAEAKKTEAATGQDKQRMRRIAELEGELARSKQAALERDRATGELDARSRALAEAERARGALDAELRDAQAKLAAARHDVEALEKRLREAEQRASSSTGNAQTRAKDLERTLAAARTATTAAEKRGALLDAQVAELSLEIAVRDQRIEDLERRLVEAMSEGADAGGDARALRAHDALLEELEIALAAQTEETVER